MTASLQPVQDPDRPFVDRIPDLVRYAHYKFQGYPQAERDEAVAEAVAAGYTIFRSLRRRGRGGVIVTVGFLHNAVRHVLNDRHVGGRSNSKDVMSKLAGKRRGFVTGSLSMQHAEGDCFTALIEDQRTGPADLAAFRIDFSAWLSARVSRRDHRMMIQLAAGESPTTVAERFGLSRPRISQLRSHWQQKWAIYQAEAIDVGPGQAVA